MLVDPKIYILEMKLKERFDQTMEEVLDKFQGVNFYLNNLDVSISDHKLRE